MVGKHRLCKDRRWSWYSLEKITGWSNFRAVHMALIRFVSFHFDLTVASGAFSFSFSFLNILIVWIEHFEPIFLLYTIIYRLFVVNMVFTWVE